MPDNEYIFPGTHPFLDDAAKANGYDGGGNDPRAIALSRIRSNPLLADIQTALGQLRGREKAVAAGIHAVAVEKAWCLRVLADAAESAVQHAARGCGLVEPPRAKVEPKPESKPDVKAEVKQESKPEPKSS